MIQESVVSLMLMTKKSQYKNDDDSDDFNPTKSNNPRLVEFFILPTYSYFGDYQILYDLKS